MAVSRAPHIRRRLHSDDQPRTARRYHAERIAADGELSTLGSPFTAAFLIAGIIILLAMLLF